MKNKEKDEVNKEIKHIAKGNQIAIYNLAKKYKAIHELFSKKPQLKQTLLAIWGYVFKVGGFCYNNNHCFFLTTKTLTEIRHRSSMSAGTSNRYINYLTAVGLLDKVKQTIDYDTGEIELSEINKSFISELPNAKDRKMLPKNTYKVVKYNAELFRMVEENIIKFNELKIKPSNISNDKLNYKRQSDKADVTYYNNVSRLDKKLQRWELLKAHINRQIKKNGYTTMYNATTHVRHVGGMKIAKETISFFKDDFKEIYNYKRPNKAEKELFDLTTNNFIITKKEV